MTQSPSPATAPQLPDDVLDRMEGLLTTLRTTLADEQGNAPAEGVVERALERCAGRYADARVHDFTLVLLERDVRDALRQQGLHARALTRR